MFRLLSVLNQLSGTHPFLGHLRFRISQAGYWHGFVHSTIIESGSRSDWTPFWANCIGYAIFSSKRKHWSRLDLFYRIKRKSRSRIWESLAMPTALSKESSLFKKKVTVTPLINRRKKRFPATDSNKTNSRTAERRSTSPQVITAFFPSGQRVRTRFRANLTWSYLPTSKKSSHSRLTKHSFGVDKGEGFSYIMLWWIGWLHSLWGKNSSFWFNCKKTTSYDYDTNTKPNIYMDS